MRPEVSVVLPVWNAEAFVAQAIESILLQTLDALELIVVDDGSTDASAAIADSFARRDPRVNVIRRDHEGNAAAMNAGIAAARSAYIARMDADDVSLPGRLQKEVGYLDAHPECVMVGSWIEVIDAQGRHVGVKTYPLSHAEIASALLRGVTPIVNPTTVIRRDAVLAAGGYDPARCPAEDLDLWMRLSEIGQMVNLPEPLLQYRRHGAAIGVQERVKQFSMSVMVFDEARKNRGLWPLRRRILDLGTDPNARYHFECARIALTGGPRGTAVRHAVATIASEPSWLLAYAILLACALPKRLLQSIFDLRARIRAM